MGKFFHEHTKSQNIEEQILHRHDLMQFMEANVGGPDLVVAADVVGSEVVGTEDDILHFLDMILREHESPRDQLFVGGSDGKRQHQPLATSATASRNRKRQHQPLASAAAIAEAQASASALASAITAKSKTLQVQAQQI